MTDSADEKKSLLFSILGHLGATLSSAIYIFTPVNGFALYISGGNAFTVQHKSQSEDFRVDDGCTKHRTPLSREIMVVLLY